MTIVYHDNYTDLVASGKRCFLFTGFLSRREITDQIRRVDHVAAKDRPAWAKIAASAIIGGATFFIPGMLLGIAAVRPNKHYYFIVVLTDKTIIPVETNDKTLANYLMGRVAH